MKSQIKVLSVILVLAILVMVSGCADQGTTDTGTEEGTTDEVKEATIGYVLWDGEIASTNVMKLVLEEAGYDVEIIAVDAGALYQGLADSQFDFTTSAWLPQTQKNYWEQYGDDIDSVAVNLEDCRIGLVVPTYVTIDSIDELNDNKDMFDGEIIGIDPGAGIMSTTETAIENYSLDYELVSSSSAGMTAELKSAIADEEWVVVTLWSPHWAFNSFDLKYLEDPNGVYGEADHVETLARVGLAEDDPELYGIISRFNWTHDDIQSVMSDLADGVPEEEAAQKWVDANPDKVNEWIGEN
ncbi:glycine betaine ABC transporter substrate-binding protein [Methanolobus sp. WCC1]|jgi:glycine betaine/proline transport system substrate-binding protein|uniref:ABC-type proline/glycine betaine transport system, periplasmic component n=1 Tax=Methanolobus tindarius DSM 2278 TaxID=1090322 RepID=W9DWB6_METTI|nr:glycine betaine ABC transporter substrate-binding protein [Methanolobus tindarius]ETA67982.1 ABC-type proline/glycine betaine transport system, periplasmic component [Methanolobus tindarius DSM 2278]